MSDAPLQLTRELFAPLVGSEFQLEPPDCEAVPVVLTKIIDRGGGLHTTQFSLLFRVPAAGPTEQDLYTLAQERVGSVQLLLVPVGQVEGGLLFEAAIALLGGKQTVRGEG